MEADTEEDKPKEYNTKVTDILSLLGNMAFQRKESNKITPILGTIFIVI